MSKRDALACATVGFRLCAKNSIIRCAVVIRGAHGFFHLWNFNERQIPGLKRNRKSTPMQISLVMFAPRGRFGTRTERYTGCPIVAYLEWKLTSGCFYYVRGGKAVEDKDPRLVAVRDSRRQTV